MYMYDEKYFIWQNRTAFKMAGYNAKKYYAPHIKPADTVLDVGCGGGHLLKNLACACRYGVEINPAAIKEAWNNGLIVYNNISSIPDNNIDVTIFSHSLEHMPDPEKVIRQAYDKLVDNGRIIVYVPLVTVKREGRYNPDDINKHLYSWTPLQLGNLLVDAGFTINDAGYKWQCYPPFYNILVDILPRPLFDMAGSVWSRVIGIGQVYCIGVKHFS